jgi:hypothetical protein
MSLAAVALCLVDARGVAAGPISANNPYRSFNISGVNYGSMRWEAQHRGRSSAVRHGWAPRRGGWLLRRR